MIIIAISSLLSLAIAVGDIRHVATFGLDREVAAGFDGHTPNMRSPSGSLWHHCTHEISRLVAEVALASLAMADRKSQIVGIAHLATASTGGRDQQGDDVLGGKLLWG